MCIFEYGFYISFGHRFDVILDRFIVDELLFMPGSICHFHIGSDDSNIGLQMIGIFHFLCLSEHFLHIETVMLEIYIHLGILQRFVDEQIFRF